MLSFRRCFVVDPDTGRRTSNGRAKCNCETAAAAAAIRAEQAAANDASSSEEDDSNSVEDGPSSEESAEDDDAGQDVDNDQDDGVETFN